METSPTRNAVKPKPIYRDYVELGMTRHDALEVLRVLRMDPYISDSTRKRLKKELGQLLKPWYTYEVKCTDCLRTYTINTQKVISKKDLAEGGICSICSEDYK